MATLTLNDVVQQLQVNKRATDDVVKTLRDWIQLSKDNMLQELENEREKKRQKKKDTKEAKEPGGSKRKSSFNFLGLPGGLGKTISGIFGSLSTGIAVISAGAVSFATLSAGLGGWEIKAIERIRTGLSGPEGLGTKIADGFTNIRTAINTAVTNKLTSIRTGFLSALGFNADGTPKSGMEFDAKGNLKLKSGPTSISQATRTLTFQVGRVVRIISGIGAGIGAWFGTKIGGTVSKFARGFILGPGGKFIRLISKILWPLTVILGAYDLVTGFIETEGNIFDKTEGGLKKMVRNMLGVPLDLIKMGIVWVMKKIFPGQVDEETGEFKDTGLGRYLSMFEDFSIAEKIDNMIGFIFDVPRNAIEWIGTLFTDPKEALTQLWTRYLPTLGEGIGSLMDIMFLPVRLAIDWVSRKFGFRDEDAPVFSFRTFIRESFDKVTEWLGGLPNRMLQGIREWWVDTKFEMMIGFVGLTEFLEELPRRIELMAKQKLYTGSWDQWARDELKELDKTSEKSTKMIEGFIALKASEMERVIAERRPSTNVVGGDTNNTTNIQMSAPGAPIVRDTQ